MYRRTDRCPDCALIRALLLLALLLRSVVPVGLMPVPAADGGVELAPCAGHRALTGLSFGGAGKVAQPAGHEHPRDAAPDPGHEGGSHEHAGAGEDSDAECVYAGCANAGTPSTLPRIPTAQSPECFAIVPVTGVFAAPTILRSQTSRGPPSLQA